MTIDALPEAGKSTDSRSVFSAKMFAWIQRLGIWTTQANSTADAINASAAAATAAASVASGAAATAAAAGAYKGDWSSLTGALNMPASVTHGGVWYALKQNLANVTTQTPSAGSAYWQVITYNDSVLIPVSTATANMDTDGGCYVLLYPGAVTLTAKASPASGFAAMVLICNGRSDTTILRNGNSFVGAGAPLADDLMLTDAGVPWQFLCVTTNTLKVFN